MFRDLIPLIAARFHIVAPDLPGFGQSDMPPREKFSYTFDNIASVIERFTEVIGFDRFAVYVFDYGAPTGFRLAVRHPERITAIISQNGNAYEEGLSDGWNPIRAYWQDPSQTNRNALRAFLMPETTRWQYTHGAPDQTMVSPDGQSLDNFYLARPRADEVQLDLFGDYKSNVALYPAFQTYFRTCKPPLLAVWGKNDHSSCRGAQKRSSATSPWRSCASSIPVTSRWKRMRKRLQQRSGSSSPVEFRLFAGDGRCSKVTDPGHRLTL